MADISFVPATDGFFHLLAIMDWDNKNLLSGLFLNTTHSDFCIEVLKEPMAKYSPPQHEYLSGQSVQLVLITGVVIIFHLLPMNTPK